MLARLLIILSFSRIFCLTELVCIFSAPLAGFGAVVVVAGLDDPLEPEGTESMVFPGAPIICSSGISCASRRLAMSVGGIKIEKRVSKMLEISFVFSEIFLYKHKSVDLRRKESKNDLLS